MFLVNGVYFYQILYIQHITDIKFCTFKILSIRLRHQWQANITTEISISGCKEEVFNLHVQIQYQLIRCNYDLLLWFFEDNVSIFFPMKWSQQFHVIIDLMNILNIIIESAWVVRVKIPRVWRHSQLKVIPQTWNL